MKQIHRIPLYRYGVKFSERILLPALIRQIEPEPGPVPEGASLPEPDPLITEYELKETVEKYRFTIKLSIYALIIMLSTIVFLLSTLLSLVSKIIIIPEGISSFLIFVFGLSFFVFWLGSRDRIKNRWMEWEERMNREIWLEKIEYHAKATSSEIIAQMLVEIERARKIQEQAAEKARSYRAIETETMKTFNELMDQREKRNQWKSVAVNIAIFIAGYLAEKGLDRVLLATWFGRI